MKLVSINPQGPIIHGQACVGFSLRKLIGVCAWCAPQDARKAQLENHEPEDEEDMDKVHESGEAAASVVHYTTVSCFKHQSSIFYFSHRHLELKLKLLL